MKKWLRRIRGAVLMGLWFEISSPRSPQAGCASGREGCDEAYCTDDGDGDAGVGRPRGAAQESVKAAPASPVKGGKVIPSQPLIITDIKEDQRVEVKYHNVNGKMHATQVRVM